jgi:hypothetical protein
MKARATILITMMLLTLNCLSQKVIISNPVNKKIYWGATPGVAVHPITFTVVNCNPLNFVSIQYRAEFASSTAIAPVFNSFDLPASPAPSYHSGNVNISITTPVSIPKENPYIVIRFQLTLTDTVIFNYDTLLITKAPPPASPIFGQNKSLRWLKDESNTFKSFVSQFTDLNGFDNQKPNGLLQEELVLKFPLAKNRRQWNKKNEKTFYQYFRSVVFTGLLNRIDKSKSAQEYPVGATLPILKDNKDSIQSYLTTMDIFKYSNLQLGLNFNVITFHTGNFRINLDYEFGVLRNRPYFADTIKVLDTQFAKTELRNIYSFVHKFEFYANNDKLIGKDFGAAINGGLMLVRLRDSYYKQFDAASIDAFGRANALLPANEKRTARPIWFLTGTFSKKWGAENKSITYLRISYNYQTGMYTPYYGDPKVTPGNYSPSKFRSSNFHNHFLQIQLGVALDIDKILESRK